MRVSYLPDKEEEVIAVQAPVRLKEEVSDEEVCPVSRVPSARKPRVLQIHLTLLLCLNVIAVT